VGPDRACSIEGLAVEVMADSALLITPTRDALLTLGLVPALG
jgi:hypothetical protein